MREAVEAIECRGTSHRYQALDDILAYIDLPPEFVAASGYADGRGIPLHLIDMDLYSRTRLNQMDELSQPG